ncbi:MAG: glycosyl hydrolase, partial [Ferruginibacter sp.]
MKNCMRITATFALLLFHFGVHSQASGDTLLKGFLTPPNAAKPRVWWHWMNGNITKDGIAKDLHWMSRSGIGGFQNFDASLGTPQVVEKRLSFMTPGWKDAFQFTTKLADSLHLEMAIAGSPGWSESGGPWVKPEDGMKKIVWSETIVPEGKTFNGVLPAPPSATGTFQNISTKAGAGLSETTTELPMFHKDIAVIAYKIPTADIVLAKLKPVVTSSRGHFDLAQLTDGDVGATNLLPTDSSGYAWIQFEFDKPQTIKAITIVGGGDRGPFGLNGDLKETRSLEASDDGDNFKRVCFVPAGNVLQQTILVPVTTAKFFRLTFKDPPTPFSLASLIGVGGAVKPPAGTDIAEIVLHTAILINRFEEKAAFAPATDLFANQTPASEDVILQTDIIDLSAKMTTDGTLNWTPPSPGNWKIIRFGYSLIGINNHPASPEATGLEVDKLDPVAVKKYFENYLDQYKSATNGLMGNKGGLQYMVTDSWEAGAQNWTGNMPQEFKKRRGYDLLLWMPVLTGHIVKSTEASEQFLWDFRKTLSELVVAYHYDQLTTILQQRGMKRYSESHESGRALIADGMDVKRTAAVPMSAMWTPGVINGGVQTAYKLDIRESASVAHIYGQNLVAAESLTAFGIGGSAWSYSPENLKPTADLELASGLNRFVIHTSVHQPTDKIPGLGLGPFGQWFNRNETWAEQA